MRKGRVRARGGQGAVPCNPDGVSPSMLPGLSCITGPLFTVRYLPPGDGSAVDRVGPARHQEGVPLELRRSSPESSTKELSDRRVDGLSPSHQARHVLPASA
ncbi:Hypothetical protein AA314_09043 [Archangium gephyra]|uniref:Uncharacterized protein n=1 Tax=Archangium gephyra TaxID=48 RepID=A0AAC8QGN0_9BACT|nr:Hypothetical protein AA314_09043 [Archangium gephyra]